MRARLAVFEHGEIEKMEEEFEARLIEDPEFAEVLFEEFMKEHDPAKMSFLQNLIASNPKLRNSPYWQDRFMIVAEQDARRERRITALLFVQQAEAISNVRDRIYALAERGEIRIHALVALKGLPDRRVSDPRLTALARNMADHETDPELRGLAIRIENDPAHAEKFLADADRTVRGQATRVVTSRDALERALAIEKDDEIKGLIEQRLSELK